MTDMSTLRDQALARLEAAENYSQTIREAREATYVDAESLRRLNTDAGAARKAAEILALIRIGDVLERLVGPPVIIQSDQGLNGDDLEVLKLAVREAQR